MIIMYIFRKESFLYTNRFKSHSFYSTVKFVIIIPIIEEEI